MDGLHDGVAHQQRDGHAQAVAEQHRAGRELLHQPRAHFAQGVRRGIAQPGVEVVAGGIGLRRFRQPAFDTLQVGHQQFQRAEQAGQCGVGARVQIIQRLAQVFGGQAAAVAVIERMAQANRLAQRRARLALQGEQALAAIQHIAVEERVGERLVRIVRGTGALMEVLRHVIQAEIQARLHARPPRAAEAAHDGGLGRIERADHLGVLFGQGQPACMQVALAHRFEQIGLELEIAAQFEKQPRQPLAHRAIGEQDGPQDRQHAVPGGADQQQRRAVPGDQRIAAAMLVHADHGVDRQGHRGLRDRGIALAQRTEQGQRERGQRHAQHERQRVRKQHHHCGCGSGETQQREQHRFDAAQPVVVGFGNGAGNGAQKQRRHRSELLPVPAHAHRHRQRDEHTQAIAGLFMGPQTAEAGFEGGSGHSLYKAGSPGIIAAAMRHRGGRRLVLCQ